MDPRDRTVGFFILRVFFAQFWFLQVVGKATDEATGTRSLQNLSIWAKNTSEWMTHGTPLPALMVKPYTYAVPYIELGIAILLALGFHTRQTLIAAALLIVSLDVGMMLKLKHDVVGNNTIFLGALLLAIAWSRDGVGFLSIDGLRASRKV
jgi:uncharacterized membrane protein YphA (DoxX/SURF4 family)